MSLFPTRRKFLKLGAAGIAAGALGIAGDGTFFEANRPKLVSLDVHLNRLPDAWDGFRIAQLSDLHYDEYFSVVPLRKAVDIVSGLQPDLIVVTGDFVTSRGRRRHRENAIHAAKAIEPCAQLLAKMHAPSGILASLGNHDVDGDPPISSMSCNRTTSRCCATALFPSSVRARDSGCAEWMTSFRVSPVLTSLSRKFRRANLLSCWLMSRTGLISLQDTRWICNCPGTPMGAD